MKKKKARLNGPAIFLLGTVIIIGSILFSFAVSSHDRESRKEKKELEILMNDMISIPEDSGNTIYESDLYTPNAKEISNVQKNIFEGRKGTYTFGLDRQPEGLRGICLAPTYSANKETPRLGLFLTAIGCETAAKVSTNFAQGEDPIVILDQMTGLSEEFSAQYKSESDYGAIWTLDLLDGGELAQEQSKVILRAVDLSQNIVQDIIELSFERNNNGQYQIVRAIDPTITDQEILNAVSFELNLIGGNASDEEKKETMYPIRTDLDYTSPTGQGKLLVQQMDTIYTQQYIDIDTGLKTDESYAKEKGPIYAVTINYGGELGFGTLYMEEIASENGNKQFHTFGYTIVKED